MSDQQPRPEDSTASIVAGFVIAMVATIAVLMASGTIPGFR